MAMSLNRRHLMLVGTAALLSRPAWASASHDIAMLNRHPEDAKQRMVFLPNLIVLQPGDTITFVSSDKGHNSESIDGMIPAGAEAWQGRINEEVSATLHIPGFYGFKCTPHLGTGMIGLAIVQGDGMFDNLDAARSVKQRGQARKRFEAIWATAQEQGLLGA